MTSEHGTSGPDNSESDLIRSLGELSEETLQQLGQFPPAFLETLAGLPAEAQTSLLRIPLETLCQLSDMDAATLEWLGKLAVTNGSGLLVRLGQLAKDAPGAMLRLQELPAQTLQILAVLPSEALMSLIALPPEQLADLPAVLRAIGEPSDEDAASTGEKQNEVPASLTETLDLFSPEAVKLLAAFDAKAMASLSQVRPELVQTLTSVPEELLRGLAEVSSGMLTTVTELSADGVQSLSEIDSVVLTDIAEGVKNTESSVPQALMMKLGTLGNTDGSMLGRLVEEARSMRELQGYSADAGKSADAGEAPIAGAPEMDDRDADDDAAGDTFDDEEGNSQTLMINDGGREVDDPGATIQSDEFAAVDEEGDSDPSYGATVQSDDFSDFSHIGTPPSEDSQDSYGATIQSDEFEAVGDISDTGYEPPIQSGEDWSADGISVFDQNEDGSYDKTVQSGEFGIGDATQSDADDGSSETMQSDEGWSEDGLNALDRDDDDSFGATIQSDSFDGAAAQDDDSFGATIQSDSFDGAAAQDDDAFGATIQSDSFDGLAAPDDSFGQTIQSDSMDVDDPGYGATIASGVFSGHAGSPGGGDLTHEESNMKDAWKESGPSRTQAETGRETSRSRGSSIPDTTLVITTRKVSTQNIKDYNRGKRPPEPREPEYELVKVLGEGGMGIVFTARQRSIDRDVAFKMLKPKTARDRDQRAKFLSEAVVTGELDHPNIVPIYDVGATADQALFYSMKKVQGIPWLDVIRDKSTSENLDILMRSADAVAFAHSRGVIHRDLKPENTMLGEFGEVLVMDWGLAYSTDEFSKSESVTASTSMGGTPAYMAPEMATGPVSKIGPHSDVYLLGAILFEIVTKRPPHAGKNAMKCLMAAARNQIRDPDPDNCTKNDPTGELMEIALKALETKPEDRFQTVQAFQAAIREYQSHRDSVTLSSRAAADLKKARQTQDYQDYSKALFAYEEASAMWSGNDAAAAGIVEARFAYAASAEAKGDFDLGMSLLDQTVPEQQDMYGRLQAAAEERDARISRIARLKKIGIGLVASILVIVSGATYAVNEQRKEAVTQKSIAEKAKKVADVQRGIAEEKKQEAENNLVEAKRQKSIADTQRGIAEEKKQEAEDNLVEAKRQETIAVMEKEKAEAAAVAEKAAKDDAVKAKDAAEKAQLAEAAERKKAEAAQLAEAAERKKADEARTVAVKAKDAAEKAQLAEAAERKKAEAAQLAEAVERKKAEAARKVAVKAQLAEAMERKKADEARKKAEAATVAEKKAKDEAVKAQLAEAMERKKADEARKKAEAATVAEKKAKETAEKARLAEAVERKKAEAAAIAETKARKEAVYQAYVASIGLADSQIRENAFEAALSVLEDSKRCPPELRNWEWGRLWHLCNQGKNTFNQNAVVDAIAVSPDGSRFVTGGWDRRAVVWNRDKGKEIFELEHDGQLVASVDWSPNGEWIVTGSNDRTNGYIQLWDAKTGKRVPRSFGALNGSGDSHTGPVLSVRFSPDGNSIVTGSEDTTARVWNVATGEHLQLFFDHLGPVWDVEFDREGERIVTASGDGTAIVWNVETGEPGPPFTGHDGPVYTAAFSPVGPKDEGWEVATGGYDRRVLLWSPETLKGFDFNNLQSKTAKVVSDPDYDALDGHSAPVRDIQFAADGNQLVSGSDDNTVRLWSLDTLQDEKTFRGHNGSVRSLVLADGDTIILTASKDYQIKQWNIAQYAEVRVLHSHVLDEHGDEVLSARFSHDGSRIVTASKDRSALTWNSATGKRLTQFAEGHQFLTSSAVMFPNGKWIATAAADNSVRVWDLDSATQFFFLEPTGRAAALAVSSDNKWLLTGSEATKVDDIVRYGAKVWNVDTQELAFQLTGDTPNGYRGHLNEVSAVAFSADGQLALTGDVRGRVILWDLKTKSIKYDLDGHSPRFRISAVAFLSDGSRALTASFDRTVAQWDLQTGQEISDAILRHDDAVTDLKVRRGDRQAVTTSRDGWVRVWDLAAVKQPVAAHRMEFADQPRSVSISDDETRAVISVVAMDPVEADKKPVESDKKPVDRPNYLSVIQLDGRDKAVANVTVPLVQERTVPLESQRQLGAAVFTPGIGDSRVVVLGGAEARLLDLETGMEEKTFSPLGVVASASFSTDGKWLVTASWDSTARIWNAETGTDIRKLAGPNGHQGDVRSAVFSPEPDSRYVLTAGEDGRVIVWERKTGEIRMVITGHDSAATGAAFSADGNQILTSSTDGTARLWNVSGLWEAGAAGMVAATQQRSLEGHKGEVLSATFSADSSRIVTTGEDTLAIVWDTASGKQLYRLSGHTAEVTAAAFSQSGDRIVTASNDNTVKVWDTRKQPEAVDADTGGDTARKEILTLDGHSREVTSVVFSPDGRYILTAGVDGKAILWLTQAWQTDEPAEPETTAAVK